MSDAAASEARGPVRLRPATLHDVDAVHAIERASFSDPWTRASFVSLVGNRAVSFRVAEEPEGGIAGYVVAWFVVDEAEIANIAVAPERRGARVGASLLDGVLSEATARGCVAAYLEVRESNAPARALYASRGFAQVGRRRGYYRRPVEDALVLRRSWPAPEDRTADA